MDHKEIPLFNGRVALCDAEDYPRLVQYRWSVDKRVHKDHVTFYAVHRISENGKQRSVGMHQLLMNAGPDLVVDHKNTDGLDNRRSNLRIATTAQNQRNRRIDIAKGFHGIHWRKDVKKWQALIMLDRKNIHIGYFKSDFVAAIARDITAIVLHGEFATLNFPLHPHNGATRHLEAA